MREAAQAQATACWPVNDSDNWCVCVQVMREAAQAQATAAALTRACDVARRWDSESIRPAAQ